MTQLFAAESAVTRQIELNFPNLFGGTEITYSRGFELFGLSIYYYGVLIAVGIILAYIYAMRRCVKDFGLVKDRVFDVVFVCIIGGFLGARIYYCVFTTLNPDSPVKYDFVTTFTTIRDGGLAIYGGIISAALLGILMCKLRKVNFLAMMDLASLGFLIGQTIGRWGNFVNQEAYGAECSSDWLFAMNGTLISEQMGSGVTVHPCFLYESVWCLLGFIFLHIYSKKLRSFDGEIALLYVAWYGLGRFFIEGLRTDSLMAGSFRVSQLVAAVSCGVSLILFVTFKIITKKKGIPLYVNSDASRELISSDLKKEEEKAAKKKGGVAPSILAEQHTAEQHTAGENTEAETAAETSADEETEEQSGISLEKSADNEKSVDDNIEEAVEEKSEDIEENPEDNGNSEKDGDDTV